MRRAFSLAAMAVLALVTAAQAYYSPKEGRWISRDPSGEVGGENAYAFLANSCLNALDAAGLIAVQFPPDSPLTASERQFVASEVQKAVDRAEMRVQQIPRIQRASDTALHDVRARRPNSICPHLYSALLSYLEEAKVTLTAVAEANRWTIEVKLHAQLTAQGEPADAAVRRLEPRRIYIRRANVDAGAYLHELIHLSRRLFVTADDAHQINRGESIRKVGYSTYALQNLAHLDAPEYQQQGLLQAVKRPLGLSLTGNESMAGPVFDRIDKCCHLTDLFLGCDRGSLIYLR